jgi:hypothetical protein
MSSKPYALLVGVALVAGLLGGVGASWMFTSRLVFAAPEPLPPTVLEAERFDVIDRAGKRRAALAGAANGAVGLTLYDKAGRARAILGLLSDGTPQLGFIDRAGKPRALLGTLPSGSTSVALLEQDGTALWQAPWSSQRQGLSTVQYSTKTGRRSGKRHGEGRRRRSKRRG